MPTARAALIVFVLGLVGGQALAQSPASDGRNGSGDRSGDRLGDPSGNSNDNRSSNLDPVIVTATRTPTGASKAIAEVTVIERAQIEQAQGRTLAELLAQQPGVQIWAAGGLGKTSAVSLRGLESRHTLLLIDGQRYGSATVGSAAWENLPLASIERIEIVRGPLSGLYGSEAVGGVVQIFTRHGASPGVQINADVGTGSLGYRAGGAGLRFGAGSVDGAVQVNHVNNRGFSATNASEPFGSFNPDADGFRQNSGTAQLGWRFAPGWRADVRALESRGQTQYDDGPDVDARARLRSAVQSVEVGGPVITRDRVADEPATQARTPDGDLVSARLSPWHTLVKFARSVDSYDTLASASPFTTLGATVTTQRQLTWENRVGSAVGTVLALAERIEQSVSSVDADYAVKSRTIDAYALGLDGNAGGHTWQANLRRDRNSQFGGQTTGAAGYGYAIDAAWRVAASYGTSFVAPSFNLLYYPFGFGNPNLLPEEGRHAEASVRWRSGPHQLRLSAFDNRIRNFISSGPQPANVPRARVDGLGLSYSAQWSAWTLAASIEQLDPRNDTTASADKGKLLPRRARRSAKTDVDVDLSAAWKLGLTLAAFSGRFEDAANTTRLPGFGTLDLRAAWRFLPSWSLDLRVNNLADKTYGTIFGYNAAGREAYLSVRYAGR